MRKPTLMLSTLSLFLVMGCGGESTDPDAGNDAGPDGSDCSPTWSDTTECDCTPTECTGCTGTKMQADGCGNTQPVACSRPAVGGCLGHCCQGTCCTSDQECYPADTCCTPEWSDVSDCDCTPTECAGCTGLKQQADGCENTQSVACSVPMAGGCAGPCCNSSCCQQTETCYGGSCCSSCVPNGEQCGRNSHCISDYCYPGPENNSYCLLRDANCAMPGADGVAFGQSYFHNGQAYFCKSGAGLMSSGTMACGLTVAQAETIHGVWETYTPRWLDSLTNPAYYPQVIYNIQVNTATILPMADYCGNITLLDDLSELFLAAADHLTDVDGTLRWVSESTGDEEVLYSTQFTYPLAYMTRTLIELPSYTRTSSMQAFLDTYVPVLRSHFTRWLGEPSMWIWTSCGLPPGVTDSMKAYTFAEYVRRKRNNCVGDSSECLRILPTGPIYCNATTEIEMWIGAAITEYLRANQVDAGAVPLTSGEITSYTSYAQSALALFESRLSTWVSTSPLCGGACTVMEFDSGSWRGHPEYPAELWDDLGVETSWDFSHARRFVPITETMYKYPSITEPSVNTALTLERFSNTVVYVIYNANESNPLFTNFFNGHNVQYRTYGPWRLSHSYYKGGFGFWGRYNTDVRDLNTVLVNIMENNNPPNNYDPDDYMAILCSLAHPP